MATFLYVVYSALMTWLAGTNEYCNVHCPGNIHVMCENGRAVSNEEPVRACGLVRKKYFEKSEIEQILNYHNDKRRYVASGNETRGDNGPQPAAVEMPDLQWDHELAALAQQLANQCTKWENYVCSNTKSYEVGQNVIHHFESYKNPGKVDLKCLLDEWYNEVDLFDAKLVRNYKSRGTSRRYAQMVAARTTKIGCGYTVSSWSIGQRSDKDRRKIHYRLVCNYGPDGLINYQPLYKVKD